MLEGGMEEDREGRGIEEKREGARRGGRREGREGGLNKIGRERWKKREREQEERFWLIFQCFTILHHFKC